MKNNNVTVIHSVTVSHYSSPRLAFSFLTMYNGLLILILTGGTYCVPFHSATRSGGCWMTFPAPWLTQTKSLLGSLDSECLRAKRVYLMVWDLETIGTSVLIPYVSLTPVKTDTKNLGTVIIRCVIAIYPQACHRTKY